MKCLQTIGSILSVLGGNIAQLSIGSLTCDSNIWLRSSVVSVLFSLISEIGLRTFY